MEATISAGRIHPARKWLLMGFLMAGATAASPFLYHQEAFQPTAPTEMSKLFRILQIYHAKDGRIIYNGNTYDLKTAVERARLYIVAQYHGENAAAWVRDHLYLSPDKGKIIYLASPDGSRRPLRDVLLTELERLFPQAVTPAPQK